MLAKYETIFFKNVYLSFRTIGGCRKWDGALEIRVRYNKRAVFTTEQQRIVRFDVEHLTRILQPIR